MYKISVPIRMETIDGKSLPRFGELLRQMGAERVFLCLVGELFLDHAMVYREPERIRQALDYFRGLGLEVGIWVNTFGHGELLAHQTEKDIGSFTPMEDARGRSAPVAFCPLDEAFSDRFVRGIRALAQLHPDLIMLDDDMRFSRRKYFSTGCFCPRHLKWYYTLLGEEVPREQLEERIFTGAPNRYRDTFLDMMGKTLLDFARLLRAAVDEVDPTIRLGASVCSAIWDGSGTDVIALSRALAGNTRPFARISGAPYTNVNIIPILERSRLQAAWGKGSGVELFCEGDTYPRPRCNVPSRPLELFDLAMACDGTTDGMLQYVFDYTHSLSYEEGYAKRIIRNLPLRQAAAALFAGKTADGVEVYDVMHKLRQWKLPHKLEADTVHWLQAAPSKGAAAEVLSRNSIPTAYEETGMPVLLLGENARHIPPDKLRCGAICDIDAAQLLQSRGVDVGLTSVETGKDVQDEYFVTSGETVRGVGAEGKVRFQTCGQVESRFLPGDTPASYRYENKDGQRFFVLGHRFYQPSHVESTNFLRSWARRRQLTEVIPWLCGKPLPAVLEDAPETQLLVSKGENAMAVAVLNLSCDEIIDPVIRLDKAYSSIQCVNCTGAVSGDAVRLSTVPPFGFAAFEVR